jgi:hypothetical protein
MVSNAGYDALSCHLRGAASKQTATRIRSASRRWFLNIRSSTLWAYLPANPMTRPSQAATMPAGIPVPWIPRPILGIEGCQPLLLLRPCPWAIQPRWGFVHGAQCPDCQAAHGHGSGPCPVMTRAQMRASLDPAADLGAGAEGGRQPPAHRRDAQADRGRGPGRRTADAPRRLALPAWAACCWAVCDQDAARPHPGRSGASSGVGGVQENAPVLARR